MKTLKYICLLFIGFAFILGCAGNNGKYRRQSESESKVTKRELVENWSDYDIWLHHHPGYKPPRLTIIIFDRKNDDKEISVDSSYSRVKDQEMWKEIVNTNTASDGEFTLVWYNYGHDYSTGVQEILGLDNQLYGFIIHQQYAVSLQRVDQVDDNTIRVSWSTTKAVGGI